MWVCLCVVVSLWAEHPCEFSRMKDEHHISKHDWLSVCVSVYERETECVRTMCSALAGQCSVQCRSEQRRPRPAQTQNPGNPCVFRSPGPYLMSLSKKKVALSFVSLSLSLSLFYSPSFSHAHSSPPPVPVPWSHFANEWIPSVYSATLSVPLSLSISQYFKRKAPCRLTTTWDHHRL